MIPSTFTIEIRRASNTYPLIVEDRLYTVKGATKGNVETRAHLMSFTPALHFIKILATDTEGNEYTISTENYTPAKVTEYAKNKGEFDHMTGQTYRDWRPGDRFYVDRFRTRLIRDYKVCFDGSTQYLKD